MEDIKLIHGDSLQALKGYAENHFDVAIVDPPYKQGERGTTFTSKNKNVTNGFSSARLDHSNLTKIHLGDRPPQEYWDELYRVSKNQIIWGGQFFCNYIKPAQCVIVWDKKLPKGMRFSDCEIALTSFASRTQIVRIRNNGYENNLKAIHPTQKPIALYRWLLENYTSEGDLILDTHLGSGSIAIACHYMKRKLIGYEIDEKYYDEACKRFKEQTMQQALW